MAGEVREGLGRQGAVDPKGESVWGLPIQKVCGAFGRATQGLATRSNTAKRGQSASPSRSYTSRPTPPMWPEHTPSSSAPVVGARARQRLFIARVNACVRVGPGGATAARTGAGGRSQAGTSAWRRCICPMVIPMLAQGRGPQWVVGFRVQTLDPEPLGAWHPRTRLNEAAAANVEQGDAFLHHSHLAGL